MTYSAWIVILFAGICPAIVIAGEARDRIARHRARRREVRLNDRLNHPSVLSGIAAQLADIPADEIIRDYMEAL